MTATRWPPISLIVAGLNTRPEAAIEGRRVVERGFFGQKDILRQEFALEALEVVAQRFFAVGEFPVPGHRLDAEQVGGVDHVGAVHGVGKPAALPQIAAVEQQRTARAGIARRRSIRVLRCAKPPSWPKRCGGFLEIEKGEGVGVGAVGADAEVIEKCAADQMRRLALHRADADIDARLAEIDRLQLRVRVGDVQHARIAEACRDRRCVTAVGSARPAEDTAPAVRIAAAEVMKASHIERVISAGICPHRRAITS